MLLCVAVPEPALNDGSGELRLTVDGVDFEVFTYYPPVCAEPSLLFVFHGLGRKPDSMRDEARQIAVSACLVVFAPLFDEDRFPNWRYELAGVVRDDKVQARSQWTAALVQGLIDQARALVNNPRARVYLFGHSGGGQFMSRLAAYAPPPGVERIVIANPSVYVTPSLTEAAPYGFGGVFSGADAQTRLQDYLALPITIYLGQDDTGSKSLVVNPAANRQGKNRLERGRNQYAAARELAGERGWPFTWKLIEVPGVGHSSGGMLQAAQLQSALDLPVKK
jgi:pimeloyl-ACP methyl ester carboxylesterase